MENQRVYTHTFSNISLSIQFFVKNGAHWILASFRFYLMTMHEEKVLKYIDTNKNENAETYNKKSAWNLK